MTRLKSFTIGVVALIAAVAVLGLGAAESAQAVGRVEKKGKPGAAQMPRMQGWYYAFENGIEFGERSVQRSPSRPRRWQKICVDYRLYRFVPGRFGVEPRWRFDWRSEECIQVRAGYQANFAAESYQPVPLFAYNAEVWVTWLVGGRRIAFARYDYNRPADYRCLTNKCVSGLWYGGVAGILFEA
jgi:hypothetical protein